MKKLLVLSSIVLFAACGLQVRDNPTSTSGNPNTNGNPNTDGNGDGTFTVGGHASGIPNGKHVRVSVNGQESNIDGNGSFTLPPHFNDETPYNVDVVNNPGGAYTCSLQNDTGTINGANVTDVVLTCACNSGSLGTGAGTAGNPTLIYTSTQLNGIANTANSTNMSKYYKQVCDLDYTGITPKPVGGSSHPFEGSFDGDGWFVLNYTSNASVPALNNNKGLFGIVQNAILKDINLSNFTITASGAGSMGALAGTVTGSDIHGIYAEDVTLNDNGQCMDGIGGLIGNNLKSTCGGGAATTTALNGVHVVNVAINAANSQNVGGVFGTSDVNGSQNIQADDVHVQNCDYQCGGIAGSLDGKATFKDMNVQNSTVEGDSRVGGITGLNYGVINRSAFVGTVNGKTTAGRFGGLVGFGTTSDPLTNSYAVADVLSVAGTTTAGSVVGAPTMITNVSYDLSKTIQNFTVSGGVGYVGNTTFITTTNVALNTWNFTTTWCSLKDSNDYPQLVSVPYSRCQ